MDRLSRIPGLLVLLFAGLYVGTLQAFISHMLYHDLASLPFGMHVPISPRDFIETALMAAIAIGLARGFVAVYERWLPMMPTWCVLLGTAAVFGIGYHILSPLPTAIFLYPETFVGDAVNEELRWLGLYLPRHRFDWMAESVAALFMAAMTFLAMYIDHTIEGFRGRHIFHGADGPVDLRKQPGGYAASISPSGPDAAARRTATA
jgi:hypothetical protein